ncbi:MAG: bifunctional oligoribonuclease/PAP phosphatase NrnA [Clostridiaceae bacterium]|nr:bifunctional oligoribonuclease/PAP phosphatase NrnA [Clostridiaceae bacterium]
MTLDNILEEIKKSQTIAILTHENPDGDAIGSSLAMYIALTQMGKNVDLIIPEVPRIYNFLPQADKIIKEGKSEAYDLAIALDCATIKLLNGFSNYFESAKAKITIDHHSTNTMFGDINFVNPDAPACAQILLSVIEYFGLKIDKEIGTCILTGMITDTGGFQYQSTIPETFEFASELLKRGVNVSDVYKRVMNTKTRSNFELRKRAMNRMEFLEDGKIAITYITKQDEEDVNAESGDYEGIVEEGRAIEGVEVSIFIRETAKGLKASLRSNSYVNVSDVCLMYGGGGHFHAAGCTIAQSLEQVKEKIVNQVKMYL